MQGWVIAGLGLGLAWNAYAQSWSVLKSGSTNVLAGVHFPSPETGFVVGSQGTILKTMNGGATWVPLNSGTDASLGTVHFVDAQRGWVGGGHSSFPFFSGEILRTGDGGATWTKTTFAAFIFSIRFRNALEGYAVGGGSGETYGLLSIFKTTDGGLTWIAQHNANGKSWLSQVALTDSSGARAVALGPYGMYFRTSDGGAQWDSLPDLLSLEAQWSDVTFSAPGTGYAAGTVWGPQTCGHPGCPEAVIVKTSDHGATWKRLTVAVKAGLSGIHFPDPNSGWAVGDSGTLLHTANAGASWTEEDRPTLERLTAVHFPDPRTGYVVGFGGVILKFGAGAAVLPAAPRGKAGRMASRAWFLPGGNGAADALGRIFSRSLEEGQGPPRLYPDGKRSGPAN